MERYQKLEETAASQVSVDSQAPTVGEESQSTSVDLKIPCEDIPPAMPGFSATAPRAVDEGGNETMMTDQPDSPLAGLSLDRAIHLRWVMRDVRAKRTNLSPISPDDFTTLIEMGLVEMLDDEPTLTNEGHRAIDWN